MASKGQEKYSAILIIILIVLGLFVVFTSFSKGGIFSDALPNENRKQNEFTSELLAFSIIVPQNFVTESKDIGVMIKNDKGAITIFRSGSLYNNIDDHVNGLKEKNHLQFVKSSKQIINGEEYLITESVKEDVTEKSYFRMIDNAVYIFSTTSPELYDTLEEVVQSFKYLGEQ
ncbi:hypothetical protein KC726_01365 [Candidatus Woesebacteria bacterium]|nr:hypothetical protein [Candidatus Woesebacteria bacterium]